MDIRLKRQVANEYPYPITIDFMRLNTPDYREPDMKRLGKIIDITEVTIHFLALIALNDLMEARVNIEFPIPDQFKARFRNNLTRTSMGKWGELLRESIKIFKAQEFPMFMEELADYFVKDKSGESKAQEAFNRITQIRNKISHKDKSFSRVDLEGLCMEAESCLETLLRELSFITDYQFLHVSKITVDYPRWSNPNYAIDLSNIIGSNPELFDAQTEISVDLVNTPAVIVTKEDTNVYLNLEPLVIYSDEGNLGIPDIFMYMDWEKGKNIKYKPIWKGGEFNLLDCKKGELLAEELLRFFDLFATDEDHASLQESLSKTMV